MHNSDQLTCFSTHGMQPALSTGVRSYGPFLSGSPSITFENSASCALAIANEVKDHEAMIVVPNPTNENGKIVFLESMSGMLLIYSSIGQLVATMPLTDVKEVTIGGKVITPGIYYYQITTTAGEKLRGNFVRE